MFNSKMIGANSAGAAQPPGTGALLYTSGASDGTGGLWISVDDGVTWSQNAFTGIDATDNTKWNNLIRWFGSYFVMRESGTRNFYSSPDGYNWSYAFTITPPYLNGPGVDINATSFVDFYADQATGYGYLTCFFHNQYYSNETRMYIYKTTDNGASFSLNSNYKYNGTTAYPMGSSVWNGYFYIGNRSGSFVSNDGGSTWTYYYDSTIRAVNPKPWAQDGTFSTLGPRFETGYATTSTQPIPNYSTWTRVTGIYTPGTSTFYFLKGDGISKVSGVCGDNSAFLYSNNDGQSYSLMQYLSKGQNVGYHNGYFIYHNNGNLYKTNDFSTEILLTADPSTSRSYFSSMSDVV